MHCYKDVNEKTIENRDVSIFLDVAQAFDIEIHNGLKKFIDSLAAISIYHHIRNLSYSEYKTNTFFLISTALTLHHLPQLLLLIFINNF